MSLDTTIGGTSADSYIALAAWEAYVLANITATALSGTDAAKEISLRRAAQVLNRKWRWQGTKVNENQAMQWPRHTTVIVDGWTFTSEEIPQAIQDAQAELAYLIHVDGLDAFATVTGGAAKRVKAGPVETEYGTIRETPRLVAVEGLIAPFIMGGGGQVRVARG
jgi:hypothetical protein